MAKREKVIANAVNVGGRVYTPGDEDDLEQALSPKMVQHLKAKKAIDGDWSPKGQDPAPRPRRRLMLVDETPAEAGARTETAAPKDEDDLAKRTKDELEAIAKARGIEVKRGDGQDGEPLKDDYLRALQ